MTSQHSGDTKWRQTTVVIRSDIYASAQERKLDISDECNRMLADKLGIDYSQQTIPEVRESPVIIAKEQATAGTGSGGSGKQIHPVMNAEDPATPTRLLKLKREPVHRRKPEPAQVTAEGGITAPSAGLPAKVKAALPPSGREQPGGRASKGSPQKKGREDLIRKFLADHVQRTDTGDGENARIVKDDLYQLFSRWWKAHAAKGAGVPDRRTFSVALKNRFAIEESTKGGVQYWESVRLRE